MIERQQNERIFGLDLMRAAAIVLVLSSHVLWIYPPKSSIISQFLQLFGFLGVELFFVLSGFLIGTIFYKLYLKDDFSIQSVFYFLKRRWFRTLPNYYLFLLLNTLIALYIGYSLIEWWKYMFFLQNFHTTMLPFFPESWSLSVEEFAYVGLPFSVLLVTYLLKPKQKKYAFIGVVIALILILFFSKYYYNATTSNTTLQQWNVSLKAVVWYRIDSIFYGVAMSWIALNHQSFWIKNKVNLAFIGTVMAVLMFMGVGYFRITIDQFPLFWNVLYLPLTSITLALFLPYLSEWRSTKLPFKSVIELTSKISYSIYLIHYGVVLQLMKHFFNTETLATYQLHLYTLVFLVITFGLSYLNYRFFERPIMNFRDKI
jgi:peptidoglycan/LPS O-acetylase OafA/YrhL